MQCRYNCKGLARALSAALPLPTCVYASYPVAKCTMALQILTAVLGLNVKKVLDLLDRKTMVH